MRPLLCLLTATLTITGLPLSAQEKPLPVLQYVDGNGNSYEFTEEGSGYLLEFEPVKKGKYSGGEPASRRVSKENYERLLARMDETIKKKRLTTTRERGTALIIKLVKGDVKEYILPKGSKDIKEIEALLYTLF
ncbi:MAG: hypothetical protein ACOY5B_11085 [Spirochaetota bacterium]